MPATEKEIVAAYTPLRKFALKLCGGRMDDASDLVQTTMARAWEKRDCYQDIGSSVRKWMMSMMHNEFVNSIRSNRRRASVSLDEALERVHAQLTVMPRAPKRIELADIDRLLREIPEEQSQAIRLIADGLNYEEIASIILVPMGTVRSRLSRGRQELRRLNA